MKKTSVIKMTSTIITIKIYWSMVVTSTKCLITVNTKIVTPAKVTSDHELKQVIVTTTPVQ